MRKIRIDALARDTAKVIDDLDEHEPTAILAKNGKRAAYLLSVSAYKALTERSRILEGLQRGEEAIREGDIVSHAEAKDRFFRKIPGKGWEEQMRP